MTDVLMKWRWILALLMGLIAALAATGPMQGQQADETFALTIRLRAADGAPLTGEPVALQRLPDDKPVLPTCVTDTQGRCTWRVGRGLYQALFDRPLDDVSALVLAEGGLRGFGLTVGNAPITYHFTLHSDGHVYFDGAPAATRPAPIIPSPALLVGDVGATPAPKALAAFEPTAVPREERQPEESDGGPAREAERASDNRRWLLASLVGLGLALGGGLHLWSERRRRGRTPRASRTEEAAQAATQRNETNGARAVGEGDDA